ncbi:hypothetical protein VNO77_04750 [Canavalia gladiata]|uniref:Uncharacterized protein n=1 Tax=Canavalia gladiata TaxID=3824 RepID=A0AAN9N274_CANGL
MHNTNLPSKFWEQHCRDSIILLDGFSFALDLLAYLLLTRVKATPCGAFLSRNTPSPEPNPEGFFSAKIPITLSRTMEEEDLRLHSPLFSPDPEPLPESTRSSSSSSSSSAVTVANTSKDFSHHSAPAPFLDQSARWTDQQHSLYLSSLEASFVKELHHSMSLRGWSIQNNADETYNCRTSPNSFNMHSQSQALQDACQKISLERAAPMLESTADSHVLAGSQFRLTSVDRGCTLGEPNTYNHGLLCDEEIHAGGNSAFTDQTPRSLDKQSICYKSNQELICSTTEVTDQNFKDEEARSSCMPVMKRLKTATADGSNCDQVVPFGKSHSPDVSTSSNSTSEIIRHELLSEAPESYHCPKYDLPYFLKGR